jgi:hypothetical protein
MDELREDVMGSLRGYGNAQMGRLEQHFKNAMGQGMAQLAASGLAGSTVGPSMRMGFQKQYQLALNDLGERMQMQQAQTQMQLGLAQEQQRAQLGTAANQQAYNYTALQQRENAQTSQQNLALGGIQAKRAADVQRFMLGAGALAQRGGGGGGGYAGGGLGVGGGRYSLPSTYGQQYPGPGNLPAGISNYA